MEKNIMAKSSAWSEEEKQLLKENYPNLGRCKELQNLFPKRNMDAIALKANRMGLKVINNIKKGRTNKEYLALVENTNFIPLETYRGSTVPILHMCGICDYEWLARPQHILKPEAKCPICDHKSRFISIETVDNTLKVAGMIRLSEYTGSLDSITLKHEYCGNIWSTKYSHIQQGSGCPVCNKSWAYTGSNIPEIAKLYLLKITTDKEVYLKVGVTIQPIKRRISSLKNTIPNCVLIEEIYSVERSGKYILVLENKILNESNFKKHTSLHSFAGHTELLDISCSLEDIRGLMDTNENI